MRPISDFALHSVLAAGLIAFAASGAAAAAYIKYDSIKGESAVKDGKVGEGWIEIESYSFGATQSSASGLKTQPGAADREASAPSISEISVTKSIDKSSPMLMKALAKGSLTVNIPAGQCVVGARHPTASLDTGYMIYELENTFVTSCSASSSGGGDARPMEQISLNYERIKPVYTSQDKTTPKTKVRGWDPEKKE